MGAGGRDAAAVTAWCCRGAACMGGARDAAGSAAVSHSLACAAPPPPPPAAAPGHGMLLRKGGTNNGADPYAAPSRSAAGGSGSGFPAPRPASRQWPASGSALGGAMPGSKVDGMSAKEEWERFDRQMRQCSLDLETRKEASDLMARQSAAQLYQAYASCPTIERPCIAAAMERTRPGMLAYCARSFAQVFFYVWVMKRNHHLDTITAERVVSIAQEHVVTASSLQSAPAATVNIANMGCGCVPRVTKLNDALVNGVAASGMVLDVDIKVAVHHLDLYEWGGLASAAELEDSRRFNAGAVAGFNSHEYVCDMTTAGKAGGPDLGGATADLTIMANALEGVELVDAAAESIDFLTKPGGTAIVATSNGGEQVACVRVVDRLLATGRWRMVSDKTVGLSDNKHGREHLPGGVGGKWLKVELRKESVDDETRKEQMKAVASCEAARKERHEGPAAGSRMAVYGIKWAAAVAGPLQLPHSNSMPLSVREEQRGEHADAVKAAAAAGPPPEEDSPEAHMDRTVKRAENMRLRGDLVPVRSVWWLAEEESGSGGG
jgi:hypothetical protein